ncbi:MAG: hypothetical protein HKM05_07420 [Spirochaetales bacterium]|nr:hypothetical protein [Spirochaetales bacterium]
MKKSAFVLWALLGALIPAFAQSPFSGLQNDFSHVLYNLGEEIVPTLQQNDLSGVGIGQATLGGSHFFISLTAGTVVSNGLLKFRNETDWNTLDIQSLLNSLVPASGLGRDLYDLSANTMPYPTVKLSAGVALPWKWELLGSGFYLPQAVGQALMDSALSNNGSGSLDAGNVVVRLRRGLLQDHGWTPALSAGVGYSYSHLDLAVTLNNFQQQISGQTVDISGNFAAATTVNSLGVDVTVSKDLFFVTPFLNAALWYQNASYDASANLTATVTSTNSSSALLPSASVRLANWAPIVTSGLDINLFVLRLLVSGQYNLATGFWGADLSTRVQF